MTNYYLGNAYSVELEADQENPGLSCLCGVEGCIWNICGAYQDMFVSSLIYGVGTLFFRRNAYPIIIRLQEGEAHEII